MDSTAIREEMRRRRGPIDPVSFMLVEDGSEWMRCDQLLRRWAPGAQLPNGMTVKESSTFQRGGMDVLELITHDESGCKLIWVLANPNKPIEQVPGYDEKIKVLSLPLCLTDTAGEDDIHMEMARRRVAEAFDKHYKLEV